MTACAVQEMTVQSHLPHINNAKLLAHREPIPFHGNLCKSLPPLPDYTITGIARARWGEDEDINRLGYGPTDGGFPRFRNNFDLCHPVSEDPEHVKHEGYMYPKPLHMDLSVLRNSFVNTNRRVPRDSKCEVFPRNNAARLQDGQHFLGDATRKAIEDNITRLYRTTRYSNIFQDTSNFMVAKAQRDAQFRLAKDPEYIETPTCSRVHNHPDPCYHCWYGGYNKDFDAKIAEFQSKLYDSAEFGYFGGKTEMSSALNRDNQNEVCECLKGTCSACIENKFDTGTCMGTSIHQLTENMKSNEKKNDFVQRRNQVIKKETFGPWQDPVKENTSTDEQMLLNDIYQFKLPSCAHCKCTQNEYVSDFISRHNASYCKHIFPDQWKLISEANVDPCKNQTDPCKDQMDNSGKIYLPILPTDLQQSTRNTWTYRDKNNLRIPCIADVIGSSRKTDAHKRYHLEHPESIPDLRDHKRYARRVRFNGFSSSVFR